MTRGVTVLEGRGGYTGKNKEVLYVVINKQELVKLKQVIRVDEDAFVVIHDVRDVLGGGFKAKLKGERANSFTFLILTKCKCNVMRFNSRFYSF